MSIWTSEAQKSCCFKFVSFASLNLIKNSGAFSVHFISLCFFGNRTRDLGIDSASLYQLHKNISNNSSGYTFPSTFVRSVIWERSFSSNSQFFGQLLTQSVRKCEGDKRWQAVQVNKIFSHSQCCHPLEIDCICSFAFLNLMNFDRAIHLLFILCPY